ncbi:MAG: hypothetical protein ACOCP8_04050 [archaeon]
MENKIPLNNIDSKYHFIKLKNEKLATLFRVREVIKPNENTKSLIYEYKVPCPVCNFENNAHSEDGKFFNNIQIDCKYCGIYFRPVVK